jgi:restriction system protein
MFLTVGIAVVLGFLLIFAMKRVPPPLSTEQRAATGSNGAGSWLETLSIDRFEWLCQRLMHALGLEVERSSTVGRRQVEMMAVNPAPIVGGQFLVHGELLPVGEVVEAVQVLSLIDAVKGEGASKGVLITNGFFSDEAGRAAAGGPVELINGVRFVELLQRYGLAPAPTDDREAR